MFPEVKAPEITNKYMVREVVEKQFIKADLYFNEETVQNVLNIIQAMPVRHGIMITGPIRSGKTTAIRTVVQAL